MTLSSSAATEYHLLNEVDKCHVCVLQDGRKLIGFLRTVDQFGNMAFQDAVERIYVDDCYGDLYQGLVVVRGENIAMLGEIDPELEKKITNLEKWM
eukprot:m.2461 g.2461  ORF g.2461 m.2461 type:complete len:96 (+) comp1793_c0_seq1:65-352(+)